MADWKPKSSRTSTSPPTRPTCTRSCRSTCSGRRHRRVSRAPRPRCIIVDTSGSMSSPHTKIIAAREAAAAAIDEIVDGTWFAVIAGDHARGCCTRHHGGMVACRRATRARRKDGGAHARRRRAAPRSGRGCSAAIDALRASVEAAQRHAILLTDGTNESRAPRRARPRSRRRDGRVPVRLPRRRRRLGRQRAARHLVGAARLGRHHRRARRTWPTTSAR